jgi:hypothetical protein
MLPQEPGIFSQALMGLSQPDELEDPEMLGMAPDMAGAPPEMGGMGGVPPEMGGMPPEMADPMADPAMMAPPEPPEDPSAEETRVVEDLIRNFLYEQGRKRMEATRQYQETVATANEQKF